MSDAHEPEAMKKRVSKKLIHEGDYVAEVDVELEFTDDPWSPYLSLDEAKRSVTGVAIRYTPWRPQNISLRLFML